MNWRLPTMSCLEESERNNAIGESIDCGSWRSFPPYLPSCPPCGVASCFEHAAIALRYSPRFAAASAGINTAVLSQKCLKRLTVAFRYGSTQRYCLIFWLIRLNKIRCPVLKSLASCQYGAVPKPRMGELAALVPSAGIKHSQ